MGRERTLRKQINVKAKTKVKKQGKINANLDEKENKI